MSNLVFIQDQPIINLAGINLIRIDSDKIVFLGANCRYIWDFSNSKQALVAYEAIKKARCADLGKVDFTGEEVKDIYDRIN